VEVWCVRYRWAGQEENAFASQAIESMMSARGKATLLQPAPGFPTTAWLSDHGWPVDPACGYGHGDMVAHRPNGCHVLGEGCVKIELHVFGARPTSSPNKTRMGCWLLLLRAGWWSPNRCSSAITNESTSTARRAGVAGTQETSISCCRRTERQEFGGLASSVACDVVFSPRD
jgi:hypothetical protein